MKFALGQLVATPAALAVLTNHKMTPFEFVNRHVNGDWGDIDKWDRESNNKALDPKQPQRVLSVYKIDKHDTIWIITEWDRSITTVLLPSDY
jgi:hypothetical protein